MLGLSAHDAFAAGPDKATCLDTASQAQDLRDAHKLLAARDRLRVCAQEACPAAVQRDCLKWLDAVEQSLPTVVVTAKDGAGRELLDVKVTADGQPLASKLTGDALPMDPGSHTLHFETPDGVTADQQVAIREGAKNQAVGVVLSGGGASSGQPFHGWRTVGWAVGGVGVVGLAVGTVAGIMAASDKSSAHCVGDACDAGPLNSARSAAAVSTVGLIAGGVLGAGGAALVLFAPKRPVATRGGLRLSPLVAAGGAGMIFAGSF
jgi:hypothetical protein